MTANPRLNLYTRSGYEGVQQLSLSRWDITRQVRPDRDVLAIDRSQAIIRLPMTAKSTSLTHLNPLTFQHGMPPATVWLLTNCMEYRDQQDLWAHHCKCLRPCDNDHPKRRILQPDRGSHCRSGPFATIWSSDMLITRDRSGEWRLPQGAGLDLHAQIPRAR